MVVANWPHEPEYESTESIVLRVMSNATGRELDSNDKDDRLITELDIPGHQVEKGIKDLGQHFSIDLEGVLKGGGHSSITLKKIIENCRPLTRQSEKVDMLTAIRRIIIKRLGATIPLSAETTLPDMGIGQETITAILLDISEFVKDTFYIEIDLLGLPADVPLSQIVGLCQQQTSTRMQGAA